MRFNPRPEASRLLTRTLSIEPTPIRRKDAFAPGLGWLAYDPTHGVKATDGHVSLCAVPSQAAKMPVQGGFYGGAVTSTLDYRVEIETDET